MSTLGAGRMPAHPGMPVSRTFGLRFSPSKKYPHLAFYLERSDHIDVWRVLHSKLQHPLVDARP